MAFTPEPHEQGRWARINPLLDRLDSNSELRAMALIALTDDREPNPFAVLAERGLPLAYAARTQQLFRYIERRLGMTSQIDREARDDVFPRLRELGIIELATVRSKAHAKTTGELLLRGKHDPPKNPNSAYSLTEEARELLDKSSGQWEAALDEFVRGDEKRRIRVQRGYGVAGYVTAYETWRKLANRQGRMKNLAVGSFVWVAEDGGKLFIVKALG